MHFVEFTEETFKQVYLLILMRGYHDFALYKLSQNESSSALLNIKNITVGI